MDPLPPTTPNRNLPDSAEKIPSPPQSPTSPLKCCCGRSDCAYLLHNNNALKSLEEDVRTAAQLGQALLARHENFMADAEKERLQLTSTVEKLERDKRDLETKNRKLIEENRNLTNQLEDLNNTVAESDTHIKSLTATLESTQAELRRLMGLAARTSELESQLMALENEQVQLRTEITIVTEDKQSAIQRWKKAERTLNDLSDQIERMERESKQERERHVEVVARLERARNVEKEFKAAAGSTATEETGSVGRAKGGKSVVSHFVKDILEDNANLQMGIVELREMLNRSNEEVQQLREQILMHQPIVQYDSRTLEEELAGRIVSPPSGRRLPPQEVKVSVHHHYHAPLRDRVAKPSHIKVRRRRHPLSSIMVPSQDDGEQFPRTPRSGFRTPSTSSVCSHPRHRWSMISSGTRSSVTTGGSSVPSSPQSGSIFDRLEDPYSSQPTSPEDSESESSVLPTYRRKRRLSKPEVATTPAAVASSSSPPSLLRRQKYEWLDDEEPAARDAFNRERLSELDLAPCHSTIAEEDEDDYTNSNHHSPKGQRSDEGVDVNVPDVKGTADNDDLFKRLALGGHKLRRTPSHESVMSVTGMDIHILQDWPPYAAFPRPMNTPTPTPINLPGPKIPKTFSKPMISHTPILAQPFLHQKLRVGSLEHGRMLANGTAPSLLSAASNNNMNPTLGKRVGGWVFGKWGMAPRATSLRPMNPMEGRASGVNQPGIIRGLRPPARTPSNVHPTFFNRDLLKDSLRE